MLDQISHDFRERFLLKLTKELVENTNFYRGFKVEKEADELFQERKSSVEFDRKFLQKLNAPKTLDMDEHTRMLREKAEEKAKKEVKENIKEKIKKETEKISEMKKSDFASDLSEFSRKIQKPIVTPFRRFSHPGFIVPRIQPLKIPEPQLPETVSYVRPIATTEEIDIGKLNVLVHDPLVKVIECDGPNDNIYVMGVMGRKKTPIKLNKGEIEQIVKTFSESAKIPRTEGLFKAAVGNLVISAVISEIVGIQFVIRKIAQEY